MPFTYDMICNNCTHKWSIHVPLAEYEAGIKCPKCKSEETHQDWSVKKCDFVLKGNGWSRDGYERGWNPETKKNDLKMK
jgi:predicted nucleic acid-binding Zn ribbon protein